MKKLLVKLENCFGIGKLEHEFNFSNSNTILIYAPNGTMKTSFANTFDCIAKGDKKNYPNDRLFLDRKTISEIIVDETEVNPISILVVNAEDTSFERSDKISFFIASKELKMKYDVIYSELNFSKDEFLKKLKAVSQSTDCESEFISTFSQNKKDAFFSVLLLIQNQLNNKNEKFEFKYNDIFDKKGKVKEFLEKNKGLLDKYFNDYQNLISKSRFFKKSDNSFGTIQADKIMESTADNAFFEAGHKFVLDGNIDIDSVEKLKNIVEEEIKKIIDDETLKKTFDKVDKAIGANSELRSFKSAIEKNNLLLVELQEYEVFKRKIWVSYLSELLSEVDELTVLFNTKKEELEKIIEEAKKELNTWKTIIGIFNSRFYVPFKVKLTNQEDIILKKETANLAFEYNDKEDDSSITKEKDSLLKFLSKGEQRAYYILQLLFDLEARKTLNMESLLIFDDIADSFDYKNKYAIIEYIKDIHMNNLFKSIILTHNFDFYRTVSSRLCLGSSSVLMSIKKKNREIKFVKGQYRKDVFKYFVQKVDEKKIFISLISFVRNIVDYTDGDSDEKYELLTCCLHIKDESYRINASTIFDIFKLKIAIRDGASIDFGDKNIIDLTFEAADIILAEDIIDETLLENKIVLSIAIRLKAELYMKNNLSDFDSNTIISNQTRELFKEFKKKYEKDEEKKDKLLILDKVNLMTPENIHINAFMYEPLIDMSVYHLLELYNNVNNLK